MQTVPRIHMIKSNLRRTYLKSCKTCTDRVVGCHSTCEKYISEKQAYEDACAAITTQLQKENNAEEVKIVNSIKTIKRKGVK